MKTRTRTIILDSNAYFRLAISIHSLLSRQFGSNPRYNLYVIEDLDREFNRSSRLKTKFKWVCNSKYRKDREKSFKISQKDEPNVNLAFSYLAEAERNSEHNLSREDLKALSVGYVKRFPVVSDDGAMQTLGKMHSIEVWSTLKFMKLMVNHKRIDLNRVRQIVEYWNYEKDLPKTPQQFRKEYSRYFGKCPV